MKPIKAIWQVQTTKKSIAATPTRIFSLDALRGLAVIGMVFSSVVPAGLPGWMHHVQRASVAPVLSGISWVDLVFPVFIFAMGAAFPFALSRRLESGVSIWKVIWSVFIRALLLAGIAVFDVSRAGIENPFYMDCFELMAFIFLFAALVKLPWNVSERTRWITKTTGYFGIILILCYIHFRGQGVFLAKSNVILMQLSYLSVAAAVIWLLTQNNTPARLGCLAIYLGLRLSAQVEGSWPQALLAYELPFPAVLNLDFFKHLFLVVPGTIVGDMLLRWGRESARDTVSSAKFSRIKMMFIPVFMIGFIGVVLAGLYSRDTLLISIIAFSLCIFGWWFYARANCHIEQLVKTLFLWASYWLILGLVFEAYQGGIKKTPATFSYDFITIAFSIFLLIAGIVIIDYFKVRRGVCNVLIHNGQNAILAYVSIGYFYWPLLGITHLENVLNVASVPVWLGLIKATITTVLFSVIISIFTRYKLFWKL